MSEVTWLDCIAPASGARIGRVRVHDAVAVQAAMARCRAAQVGWGARSIRERLEVLARFQGLLVRHGAELARLLSLECGKPEVEAYLHEVTNTVAILDWLQGNAEKELRSKAIPLKLFKHRRSTLHYRPRGVVGIIAPWNFPMVIPIGDAVMALAAGNGVVLKPSEETPLIALRCAELLGEAGLPDGLFEVIVGAGETGKALLEALPDKVVFTGSVATGRRIGAFCGERLIPCVLELGGKAPAIVLPDADVERTAKGLVWGGFLNSGQVCAAVERVYVHRSLYGPLVDAIVTRTRALRHGDPLASSVDVGSLNHPRQLAVAAEQVEDAKARGARVLTGGAKREGEGRFFELTVLADVPDDAKVMREETFGPLLPIAVYDDVSDAIRRANDTHLGLTAYIFTRDIAAGERLALEIRAGTVMINDVAATHGMPETPWHGLKASGLGRIHSADGLRDMCEVRHVHAPRVSLPGGEPYWFPYLDGSMAVLQRGVAALFGSGRDRVRAPASLPTYSPGAVVLPAGVERG